MNFLPPLPIISTAVFAAEPTIIKLWPSGAAGQMILKPAVVLR
jgi:hypothetical protein